MISEVAGSDELFAPLVDDFLDDFDQGRTKEGIFLRASVKVCCKSFGFCNKERNLSSFGNIYRQTWALKYSLELELLKIMPRTNMNRSWCFKLQNLTYFSRCTINLQYKLDWSQWFSTPTIPANQNGNVILFLNFILLLFSFHLRGSSRTCGFGLQRGHLAQTSTPKCFRRLFRFAAQIFRIQRKFLDESTNSKWTSD